MSHRLLSLVTFCSALGCGLIAGVFFAFSSFVMPALARLPPMQGIAAMQSINVAAINRWFLGALFGTAGITLVLAVSSLLDWSEPQARYRLAGSVLYLAGTIVVTMAFNVPRNDALATVQPESVEAAAFWHRYIVGWTAWNHVRAVASLSAAALLTIALLHLPAHLASASSKNPRPVQANEKEAEADRRNDNAQAYGRVEPAPTHRSPGVAQLAVVVFRRVCHGGGFLCSYDESALRDISFPRTK